MSINKDSFRALPIKERAALINKYVSGGMMDLGEMRRHYNSFDTGGDTDGDGNIVLDWIRKQLYDKIDPVGYNKFVDRVKAAILGKGEDRYNKARDDIFATYLKIPKDERHNVEEAKKVSDATYTPTKSSEDSTYHKIELTDKEKDALIYDALRSNANVGDNSRSHVFEQFFGPHQVGRGKDEKGEYVSYYDLWDLDPSSGESKTGDFEFLKSLQELLGAKDMSLGIGEPVEFYDRIYLNDYYGVTPQIDEGDIEGGYLPLAYVEASAGTGSAAQLTGEDYYDAGESSIPTYSKGGKLNIFDIGGNTDGGPVETDGNNEEPIHLGELETAVVKPAPVRAELNTYYPITSKYPFTGHSELIIHDNKLFHSPTIITSGGYHPDYNFITNNCSDATRCAIEQIYGEKIDPFLFTTPGDVRDFLLEKGVDIYETDKGKDSQFFEIPFATAMDLKNKSIDDTIYRLVMWAEEQRERLQENPNWDSISFDAAMHDTYRSLENEKYKFQPFVNGYEIDENGNYIKAYGGDLNIFDTGGNTEEDDTSKKTSNNKAAIKRKIDKTLFFTIAKQFGFTPKQLQDLAYLFGSDAAVSEKGYAGIEDILRILSPDYKPTNPMDDNKRMFLYGNVNGLPPAENTNGKDFSEYINATYPGANIKSYQGVINPFNEYVIDIRDKGLLEELAAKGENLYVDADVENGGQQYTYRDDVASYAFKPVVGNNGLMISAADLYDFGPDYNPAKYDPNASKTDSFLGKLESKLLGFVGNPYILRQDNIPIRFIDYNNASKEDISRAEDLKYAIKNGMMSAKEFDEYVDIDKKISDVLGNGFLEPITVVAEAKKAKGGKVNKISK